MIEFIPSTLLNTPEVTGLVGSKIKPVGTNQGGGFPYITFQVVSDVPDRCREGIAVETVRVQVSAYATTYGETQTLYKAIRKALDGKKNGEVYCEWLNAEDMYRDEGQAHGKAIDFELIIG